MNARRRAGATLAALAVIAVFGCAKKTARKAEAPETTPVTAWGKTFEVFAEIDPLIAGATARSNTHITALADFSPLREGSVSAVLKDAAGRESVFTQDKPKRDGIFSIELKPEAEGSYDLAFRIVTANAKEELAGGKVRVGTKASPPPAPPGAPAGATAFLKEQQWKTEFATAWAEESSLPAAVTGRARVVPSAGGEVVLTGGVEAVLASAPWPHRGETVNAGSPVFRLVPRVAASRSLPEMEGEVASQEAELAAASARARRLEGLLKVEAISRAEVERVQATETAQKARLEAARRDLSTARSARTGGGANPGSAVNAPFAGLVAEVLVTPGQSVEAGTALARLVKTRPVWLDVALAPSDAARVGGARGLYVRAPGSAEPISIPAASMRIVSRAPEVDPKTGTVGVLVEVDKSASELPLGTALEAELLLSGERRGVVAPASALVDDGGTTVVYEQVSGESFARREVKVAARRGPSVLVEGVTPGARLVTKGAAAIRRAAMLSSGAPEGHVH